MAYISPNLVDLLGKWAQERADMGEEEWKRRCDEARYKEMRAFLKKYGTVPRTER